jgi:predicted ester cyclase
MLAGQHGGIHVAGKTRQGTIVLLGAVLFVVLGITALLFAILLDEPATAQSNPSAENEAITREFYAAVNHALRTGDLTLLDHVFVTDEDDVTGAVGTTCDLRCRVGALHRLDPDVRVQLDDVLVDGDQVVARLSVQGNDRPAFLGLALQGALAPWESVDFLRLTDGLIDEVQPAGDLPTLVEPLGRTALETVPTAPYRLGLVRLTLGPSAAITELSAGGPVVLLVESGTLAVRVDQVSRVQGTGHAGDPARDELRAAGDIVLSPGERIALGPNTSYALRNTGNEEAVILSAAALPGDEGPTNRWVRARSLDEMLFNPGEPDVVAQTSPSTPWPPGVQTELLVDGVIKTRPAESATLALTRLTLAPNASLPVHDTSVAELLAVETGSALVDLVAGDGAIRPRPRALQLTIRTAGDSSARDPRLIEGGGAVLQPGSLTGVRNVGDEPLVLLILTLEPGSDPA